MIPSPICLLSTSNNFFVGFTLKGSSLAISLETFGFAGSVAAISSKRFRSTSILPSLFFRIVFKYIKRCISESCRIVRSPPRF